MNRTVVLIGLLALVAFGVGMFGGVLRHPAQLSSNTVVFPTPRSLPVVRLSDHHGDNLVRERFLDGWDLLFFGFTRCPDICPTTLFELSRLSAELADLRPELRPRIWLVSVDPERDTPQILADYLAHFGPEYSGITGSPAQIAQLAGALGVAYQPVAEGDDYTIAHTAALFLIDPTANLVALFTAPHDMDRIAHDYRALIR